MTSPNDFAPWPEGFPGPTSRAHTRDHQARQHYPDGAAPWQSGRCAFCGSLTPTAIAEAIRAGAKGEWADWKYGWPHKAYFDGAGLQIGAKFYTVHLLDASDEDRATIEQHLGLRFEFVGNGVRWSPFGTPMVAEPAEPGQSPMPPCDGCSEATAPAARVTKADVEAAIAQEHYFTATDRELLELAAKAIECTITYDEWSEGGTGPYLWGHTPGDERGEWNPLTDAGDRYRLAQKLGLSINFVECTVWKVMPDHTLIQAYWGDDYGDDAHAVVSVAAAIGRAMP